ncbi:MAG: helix-turn-helix domain-containing protein, partial [Vreelandella alkaliphila]
SLAELDIECVFEKGEGERHNIGHYQIRDWGAIDPHWVATNAERLKQSLGYA